MAAKTRTPTEIERDRLDIERRYLRLGQTQVQIASELGLTRSIVAYDLGKIKDQWREARLVIRDQHIDREYARIGALEQEYWNAWERSRQDAVTRTTERLAQKREGVDSSLLPDDVTVDDLEDDEIEQALSSEASTILKQIEKRTGQVGAPSYLAGVQWCSDARRKLLGLDAPTKVAPVTPEGDKEYGSDAHDDLSRKLTGLAAAVGAGTLATQPDGG